MSFSAPQLRGHGRIAPGQLLDRHILGLVVREAQVAVRADQRILRLLQMIDGLIDLSDGRLEVP